MTSTFLSPFKPEFMMQFEGHLFKMHEVFIKSGQSRRKNKANDKRVQIQRMIRIALFEFDNVFCLA